MILQKKSLALVAAILSTAALLPVQEAAAAAALVKNVDEPGRQPYEAWVEFYPTIGCSFNCSNFNTFGSVIVFDAPAVPAGKRLVVQWVSAMLPSGSPINVISLQSSTIISNQYVKWQSYGPFNQFFPGTDVYGMSSAAYTTYGPGEQPHIRVQLGAKNNYSGNVVISGYLIDAN